MRALLLLCALASPLSQAQQSSSSTPSAPAEEDVPAVVKLASQKVTLPVAQLPMRTLDGKDSLLGDHGAKVVVVSMWATIKPDLSYLGLLEKLHQSYKGRKDVTFLAINVDLPKNEEDLEVLRGIAREHGVTAPVLLDKELKLLALVNERFNSGSAARNSFIVPPFLLLTRGLKQMDMPDWKPGMTDEDMVKELRQKIDQARKAK